MALGLSLICLLGSISCGPRKWATAPVPQPTAPAPESRVDSVDPAAELPELEVEMEPARIRPGESARLIWASRNADAVEIEPGIGPVQPAGRITLFPEETSTYRLVASGPGGRTEREVSVDVVTRPEDEALASLPLEERFRRSVKPVFFALESAELTEESRLILEGNVRWLARRENEGLRILIEGHCDPRGSEEYNLALGDKRAQVVRAYLAGRGISEDRLLAVSMGEERPLVEGSDENAFALNRRAHFVLWEPH